MAHVVWDKTGEHYYETGIDHGVLYHWVDADESAGTAAGYNVGYAWNGLTSVSESPSGAEETKLFADNIKYLSLRSAEEFGATIEAYTYPDEFGVCDGTDSLYTGIQVGQQGRKMFGLCYRTIIGNDIDGDNHGYKLHLIYGCTASPSEKGYQTVNDSPEAVTFSWEMTTVPVEIKSENDTPLTYKATSVVTIDSTKLTSEADKAKLAALEKILYGTDANPSAEPPIADVAPRLPLPGEIYDMFNPAG